MARRQVNVRLSEKEFEKLDELAKRHNKSRSEIVRTAFQGELAKMDDTKVNSLSYEERKKILENVGATMTYMSKVERVLHGIGNNVNQIAKAVNQGRVPKRVVDEDKLILFADSFRKDVEVIQREMDKIWRSLV